MKEGEHSQESGEESEEEEKESERRECEWGDLRGRLGKKGREKGRWGG